MSDRYAAINAHRDRYPIDLMCRALEVSTSGFHKAMARKSSAHLGTHAGTHAGTHLGTHALVDERLRMHIRATYKRSRGRYGAPRVHEELRSQGIRTARKRVARLMREDDLRGRRRRKRVVTTDSAHTMQVAPNLLARRFRVAAHTTPDRVWCGDMTYIPTAEGWLYLAIALDLSSRRVVGWATGTTLATTLPLTALNRALKLRCPPPGLTFHSDRGSQYASADYRTVLEAHGITQSMSRRGDCYDNAVCESFFATLEHELLSGVAFRTRKDAHRAVAEFIDTWYNVERLHSSLGYRSPLRYEEELRQMARAS